MNKRTTIRRRVLAIGIPTAALLVGVGIGTSATGGVPEPRVETKIETREVPVEVEKKVEVAVTPDACTAALDYAEEAQEVSGSAFEVTAEMMDAVSQFDVATLEARTAELDSLRPDLQAALVSYRAEAAECRAN